MKVLVVGAMNGKQVLVIDFKEGIVKNVLAN